MNELTTTNQHRRPRRNMAVDVSRPNVDAMGDSAGSVRKRTGPLPPLKNVLEMEDQVKALEWQGTILSLLAIFVVLVVIWGSICDMMGWFQ